MYFVASKIFWLLVKPSVLALLGITGGILLRMTGFKRLGLLFFVPSFLLLWVATVIPFGDALIHKLETRFPVPTELPASIGGIIVLGGAIDALMSRATAQVSINGNVERLLYFKHLADKYPDAPLIFTGGSGSLFDPNAREADYVRQFGEMIGLDLGRVLLERKSRNTYENAKFSKEIAPNFGQRPWILITSARHMPRAVGIFRKQDWSVIPYPVDFLRSPEGNFRLRFQFLGGLAALDTGAHEFAGLLAAALFGHSNTIFPMPDR